MSGEDDFKARLSAARKDAIKSGLMDGDADEQAALASESAAEMTGFGQAYKMAIELVVGVGMGGFIGYIIDEEAGTKPLFLLIFLALGFAAGLLNVYRSTQRLHAGLKVGAEQDTRPPETRN